MRVGYTPLLSLVFARRKMSEITEQELDELFAFASVELKEATAVELSVG